MNNSSDILIIGSNFYPEILQAQIRGATKKLTEANYNYKIIEVAGALEIAPLIKIAYKSKAFKAFIALGCVIKGETYHFEIVANNSAYMLSQLSIKYGIIIGNGILTCNTMDQALDRSEDGNNNKGWQCANAVIKALIAKDELLKLINKE